MDLGAKTSQRQHQGWDCYDPLQISEFAVKNPGKQPQKSQGVAWSLCFPGRHLKERNLVLTSILLFGLKLREGSRVSFVLMNVLTENIRSVLLAFLDTCKGTSMVPQVLPVCP